MNGNLHLITKEQVVGHTIVIASMQSILGCKIMSYTIGAGYCVTSSLNEDTVMFTKSMDEAIHAYNSVNIGCTSNGDSYTYDSELQ